MFKCDTDVVRLRSRSGMKWQLYDSDVLPAWVADMDFDIAEPIHNALERHLQNNDLGYPKGSLTVASGLHELFTSRVKSRFGWTVEREQVEILNDVVQGIYLAVQALTEPHEGVVIQTPIYPPFLHAVAETHRHGVLCPLEVGELRYEIDFDQLEADLNPQTRMLLFCNPHNPTGRVFDRGELERIAEIACRHDLLIVSDEIHADLILGEGPHIPIAALDPEIAERTVTLMSASKAFNIAGLCIAFAVFGGSELQKNFNIIPRHTRGGVNTLSAAAVRAAWTESQPWLDGAKKYLRRNRDHVFEHCRSHWHGVQHFAPEATYLAWFDMRSLDLKPSPFEFFLKHSRVAVMDGELFGDIGRGYVRLNFATSEAMLDQILIRMTEAMYSQRLV